LESIIVLKYAKGFLDGLPANRTREILKLNRNQPRRVTGLFTGYFHLKGHFLNWNEATLPLWKVPGKNVNQPLIFYMFVRQQLA
jgi:hypothetical protein